MDDDALCQSDSSADRLFIGILGPLTVSIDGRPVLISARRLRMVLVVLALSAGEPVRYDRLATALWGEDQPKGARRALQLYVTRLRQRLGKELIQTAPGGYLLATNPDVVDAVRFGRLLDAARIARDAESERTMLVEALALWRGEPFDGLQSAWLEGAESSHLSARRLAAVDRRIELDIAARRPGDLVAEIEELTIRHPLREQYWGYLMTVLAHAGRRADALEAYKRLYRLLAEELGIEPSSALRELHTRILDGDLALDPRACPGVQDLPTPKQLPTTTEYFAGRTGALAHLDALLPGQGDAASASVVISVITGPAGSGKTALAVHWARRVVSRFPDGQLYVNLRGFDASGTPLSAGDVIRQILDSLGMDPRRIPADPEARAGLFRTLLAGRRMLVVLDNARDSHQVRPLLPGAGGCMVVVTSRERLAGLVAHDGAHPLEVGVLTRQEAVRLLTARLGPERVGVDAQVAWDVVELCELNPLALNVFAARAMHHPTIPLTVLAAELRDVRQRLDTREVRNAYATGAHSTTDIVLLTLAALRHGEQTHVGERQCDTPAPAGSPRRKRCKAMRTTTGEADSPPIRRDCPRPGGPHCWNCPKGTPSI